MFYTKFQITIRTLLISEDNLDRFYYLSTFQRSNRSIIQSLLVTVPNLETVEAKSLPVLKFLGFPFLVSKFITINFLWSRKLCTYFSLNSFIFCKNISFTSISSCVLLCNAFNILCNDINLFIYHLYIAFSKFKNLN